MSSSSEYAYTGASLSSSGSTPKPSRRYEVGDEVELTVRITRVGAFKSYEARTVGYDDEFDPPWHLSSRELDAGRLKPRPIKVGDWVRYNHGYSIPDTGGRYFILAIEEGQVLFRNSDGGYGAAPVSQLVKV